MDLAKIFGSGIVLQAGKPIRFFGTGKGNIKIIFDGKVCERTVTDENWVIELPSCRGYGESCDISFDLNGKKKILYNVIFGDVFLCAGQSNMQFTLAEEAPQSDVVENPMIRYFVSDRIEKHCGQKSDDGWQKCTKNSALRWSAIGYHFAQAYFREKNVPIGVVGCFQGASGIRSWVSKTCLTKEILLPIEKLHGDYSAPQYSLWNKDGALYEKTFLPILPFTFKSVIWYQGESDTTIDEGKIYKELLKRMILCWRKDLRDEKLPFVIVEICDYDDRNDDGWRIIQQKQRECAKETDGTIYVQSSDVCNHENIHPARKICLANRIAEELLKVN